MVVCTGLVILLSTLVLSIIAWDRACHTVPMMLSANSCMSALLFGCSLLSMCIFTLKNDLQQIKHQDSFCLFRAYLIYAADAIFNHSYVIQALYRYLTIIYPTRLFWQSVRFQFLCIFLTWIFGFIYPTVFIFTKEILYNVDNQICQLPIRPSFSLLYAILYVYFISHSIIIFVYVKLVRYIRAMSKRVLPANTLLRAQRELKMVQRTVTTISI